MAWTELGIENIAFDNTGDDTKTCNPPSGANFWFVGGTYYIGENRPVDLVEMAAGTVQGLQSISGGGDNMSCYLAWGKVNVAGSASTLRRRLTGGDGYVFNEGPTAQIVWMTVDDPDTAMRDWGIATPGPGAINTTVDSAISDAVYAFHGKDSGGGTLGPASGWTQRGTTQTNLSDQSGIWRANSPGASSTVATANASLSFPTLMAISIQNSGSGTPPTFNVQPTDETVTEGDPVIFSADVSDATSYQWKIDKKLAQNVVGIVPLAIGTAQNPGAQSITVPVDATAVIVFGTFGSTGGAASISSFATNFTTSGTLTPTQNSGAGFSAAVAALVGAVNNTSAGRTFTPAFNRTVEIGAHFTFIFLKNINPASLTAAVQVGVCPGPAASNPATASGASNAAKMVIGYDARGGTVPSNQSGWTSLATDSYNVITPVGLRIRQLNTPGDPTSTITSQDSNNSVVAIVSINERGFQNADVGTGGTTDELTINPTTAGMNGWDLKLSAGNTFGSTDSDVVTLTVNPASGPPVLSDPTGAKTGSTTATGGASTDQGSGNRWTIFSTLSAQPTETQIKAGQQNGGGSAAWASGAVAVVAPGAFSSNATGLAPSTTYYAHSYQENGDGDPSNIVTSAGFTTDPPAGTPPVVTITSVDVSGQTVTISGTYTGIVDSASVTIGPNDPANGAVSVGPIAVPYSGGTFEVVIEDMVPGSYLGPAVLMVNTDGSDTDNGAPFEILGIDGDPDAPGEVSQAESAGAAESTNRSLTASRTRSDSVVGAETTNRVLGISRAQAESAAAADAPTRTLSATRAQAEAASGAEASSSTAARTSAQAESAAAADAPSGSIQAASAQDETAAGAEATSASVDSIPLSQAENAASAESTSSALSSVGAQDETVGALDLPSATVSAVASQAESAAAMEFSAGFRDLLASVAESVGPMETIQAFAITGVFTLELAQALEAITGEVSIIAGDQIEAVVVNDEQLAALVQARAVQEVVAADDQSQSLVLTGTTVYETVQVTDITSILKYPVPTRSGPYAVRVWRIRFR